MLIWMLQQFSVHKSAILEKWKDNKNKQKKIYRIETQDKKHKKNVVTKTRNQK